MKTPAANTHRLIIDTNVLVLFAVGSVNRQRIETFKRTRQYTVQDFDLLVGLLSRWQSHYTVPHVLAEVSNLTDLGGEERGQIRELLKQTISLLTEIGVSSAQATLDPAYHRLGLVDASIATVAREHECAVLTDDLDLYLHLEQERLSVINFTHIRAQYL